MNEEKEIQKIEESQNFESLYTKLYNENFEDLEKLRKKEKNRIIKYIVLILMVFALLYVFFICCYMKFNVVIAILTIILGGVVTFFLKTDKLFSFTEEVQPYEIVFKDKIIKPIFENMLPDVEYTRSLGIKNIEYANAHWEIYHRFSSEDMLKIPIKVNDNETKLYISEVFTERKEQDEDGTYYVGVFHGMAGYVKLPKTIKGMLKVVRNGTSTFGKNLKIDMSEFEKIFDVKTSDKIKAMQLLTSDVMYDMVDLVNQNKTQFEFYIVEDMLYIRFHTGSMFEPELFGKAMQFDELKKYFDLINMIRKVVTDICNVVVETEF